MSTGINTIVIFTNEDDWMEIYRDSDCIYNGHLNFPPSLLKDLLESLGFTVVVAYKEY